MSNLAGLYWENWPILIVKKTKIEDIFSFTNLNCLKLLLEIGKRSSWLIGSTLFSYFLRKQSLSTWVRRFQQVDGAWRRRIRCVQQWLQTILSAATITLKHLLTCSRTGALWFQSKRHRTAARWQPETDESTLKLLLKRPFPFRLPLTFSLCDILVES